MSPRFDNSMGNLGNPLLVRRTIGGLAPTLYSPIGQWRLVSQSPSVDLVDRSGYGRDLTPTIAPTITPDLRSGWFCPSAGRYTRSEPAFRLLGEMTITLRAWGSRLGQTLLSCTASGESADTNCLYQIGNSGGPLGYFFETGSGTNQGWTSSLTPTLSRWQFFAFRREASGVVTLTLDNAQQTSGALPLPTTGSSPAQVFSIGDDPSTSGYEWRGGIGDFAIWSSVLTDAQLALIRSAMMGT